MIAYGFKFGWDLLKNFHKGKMKNNDIKNNDDNNNSNNN